METRSKYFSLPHFEPSTTANKQTRQQAEEAFAIIKKQLEAFHARLLLEVKSDPNRENNGYAARKAKIIADDLVFLTRQLPHHLALNILIESLSEPLFQDHDISHVILDGITKENYKNSTLITGEQSLDFVLKFQITNPKDVESFLKTPDWLLMWIDKASALETSRLFQQFYYPNSENFEIIRKLAAKEYDENNPGRALLCFTLMSPSRISEIGAEYVMRALRSLDECEPVNKYERVTRSLRTCILANSESILDAKDCYINLNKIKLPNTNFTSAQLRGANFKSAEFDNCIFANADLTGAIFDNAVLTGVDFSGATLSHTSLKNANLKNAKFFRNEHFESPAAFKAELNRLHTMIDGHKQETMLRTIIIESLIACTRNPLSINFLQIADEHPFCNKHKDMQVVKVGFNLALSAYNSLFNPVKVEPYQTEEQRLLREEIKDRKKLLAASAASSSAISSLRLV